MDKTGPAVENFSNSMASVQSPPKQGCSDGYLMKSYEHHNPTWGTCSKITCTKP